MHEWTFPFRFFAALKDRLLAWFADAQNGITKFFAGEVRTEKLCVGETCVTSEEFAEVFGSSQSAAAAGAPEQGGTEAPAVSAQEEDDVGDDDGAEVATDTSEPTDASPTLETLSPSPTEAEPLELDTANDNDPPAELPATGTDG